MQERLHTDEYTEAITSLEMVVEQTGKVHIDVYRWKWIIIALHNAVQAFMVLALKGTSNHQVLKEKSLEGWNDEPEAWSSRAELLRTGQLDDFLRLYDKIKKDYMLQYIDSRKFVAKGTQGSSVKKLNELRNEFVHFMPKEWQLELQGLPSICLDSLHLIEFLGWESGNVRWGEEALEARAKSAVTQALAQVHQLHKHYGA